MNEQLKAMNEAVELVRSKVSGKIVRLFGPPFIYQNHRSLKPQCEMHNDC